jgi:hypothetical protein
MLIKLIAIEAYSYKGEIIFMESPDSRLLTSDKPLLP